MPSPPLVRLVDRTNTEDLLGRAPRKNGLRLVMLVDGGFLACVGLIQMSLELVGHHLGAGPFGRVFDQSPYTIGWVEAHGLAGLVGVLFLVAGGRDRQPHWHGFALAVHLLLGGANLMFWSGFVTFGTEPIGVLATVAHLGFVLAQAWCLIVSWSRKRP
jgi:hypothetical protein